MAYTISTIGKVALGTNIQSQSMKFQTDGPLDDRSALKVPASLISQDALGHVNYVYPAMTCSIQSTGDVYILKDKSKLVAQGLKTLEFLNSKTDEEIEALIEASGWVRLPNMRDVSAINTQMSQNMQQLAGVFQFKGVADAIDADHTTITLKSGTKTVTGSDPVTGYVCNGFYYDVAHDKYYEWTKDSDTIYVKGTEVYTKSGSESSTLVYYVDYADTRYYAHAVSNDKITSFQSLDGGIIYPAGDGVNSETATTFYADSSKTVSVGSLTPHSYPAYTFTLVSGATFSGSAINPGEGASGNNGHVYQIGEKEYASNGLIWVELGSPKEEITWLVL